MTGIEHEPSVTFKPIIADLREEIDKTMEEQNIPGLAIAIVTKAKLIWTEGFGYTDKSKKQVVNIDTFFSLGSTSKTVTAVAFLIAQQQGLVKLDDPIIKYYPEFTVKSRFADGETNKITFRHLLSHRSGLAGFSRRGGVFDNTPSTWEERIRGISDSWLRFPVGEGVAYSNAGMDLVAYVLERITGKSFPDYVNEYLGTPLGIKFHYDANEVYTAPNAARGHLGDFEAMFEFNSVFGCGGAYSSIKDLATFTRFLLNHGALEGKEILKVDYIKAMYSVDGKEGYGLGTIVTRDCGISYPNHSGGANGLGCEMIWVPEYNIGIAGFFNQEYLDISLIKYLYRNILKRVLRNKGLTTEFTEFPTSETPTKNVDTQLLERLVGIYKGIWRPISIVYSSGKLYLDYRGGKDELIPHSETSFSSKKYKGLIFQLNESKNPQLLTFYSPFNGVVGFKYIGRLTDLSGPNRPEWKKHEGIYRYTFYNTEADYQVVKLEKDGYLYAGKDRLYEHENIPNVFFTFTGDAVVFGDDSIYHDNARGEKITDPVAELSGLAQKDPNNRYLQSWVLDQVINALKRLERLVEADQIIQLKQKLTGESS